MKMLMRAGGVMSVVVAMGILAPAVQAQTSIQAELLKDWTLMKGNMHELAAEMPEDKFTYKSTPAQRDFAQQVQHVAQVNGGLLKLLGGKAAAPAFDAKVTGKAAVIKQMDDSFDYGIELLKEQTDQTMRQGVMNAPDFMGPSSRARVVYFLLGHTWNTYGQMVVYLRLNGHVPPYSQRP